MAGKPLRGRNQWPEGHERMRAAMLAYFKALEGVGERMLPVLARSLDMPAGHFAPVLRERGAHQPALPPLPAAGHRRTTSSSARRPHTDNSFITMLARDEVPGLAVRLPTRRVARPAA